MTKKYRKGFVAGKFSPLHLGHESLIEYATVHCEQVTVLSYSVPEFKKCGRAERERWLKGRFPQLEVLVLDQAKLNELTEKADLPYRQIPHNDADAWAHREFCSWVMVHILGTTCEVVFSSEDYGDGLAAHMSQYFAANTKNAPTVKHILYDIERKTIPVSGTAVREDPIGSAKLVSSNVYASLMPKLVLLGGESSGKTTLAKALAAELETAWVSEYGRDAYDQRGGRLYLEDMLHIAKTQIKSELVLARRFGNKLLVCDTSPLTTLFYSYHMFGQAHYELRRLAERYYDFTVLCAPNIPFEQDGTREGNGLREAQHEWYKQQLSIREIPYLEVTGTIAERVAQVRAYVGL